MKLGTRLLRRLVYFTTLAAALILMAVATSALPSIPLAHAAGNTWATTGSMATKWRKWHKKSFLLAASGLGLLLLLIPLSLAIASPSAAPGDLDTTFDTDGKLTTNFGGSDIGYSVAIQGDGRIVVAGYSDVGGTYDFALARYNANGTLDTTFDADGKLTTDFGGNDAGYSVAIQGDGKIVVAGETYLASAYNFALARYNTDGSLDTSFDADGRVTTNFGGDDIGKSVAIQSDGRIVVAGYSNVGGTYDFALARYNANGSLDTSFDADGKVTTDFGGNNFGQSVAIQSDGRIVAAGRSGAFPNYDSALARYNADGSLDASFNTGGKVTTDFGGNDFGYSVAIQGDGRIVVAGHSDVGGTADFAVARYNADGTLDTTFDADGKVTTDFGGNNFGQSVAIQSNGKIVVAGYSGEGVAYDFAVARYNADGSLTTSFGAGGKVTTDFGGYDIGQSVAIQSNGKIVVAGYSGDGVAYDFAVARYTAEVPPPYAYVANLGSDNVSVIDTSTDTVIATIAVGDLPYGVAANPAGTRVYVTNFVSNTVSVIDTSTNTVVATIAVGTGPNDPVVSPDGSRLYVPNGTWTSGGGTVSVVDTSNNTVIAIVGGVGDARDTAITPDGSRVYVSNAYGPPAVINVINTATNTVAATVDVGGNWSAGIALSPNGMRAYVSVWDAANGYLKVVDTDPFSPTYHTVVASLLLAAAPSGNPISVTVSPDGSRVYVHDNSSYNIYVVKTADTTLLTTLGGFIGGSGKMAFTPDGKRAYATTSLGLGVKVVDTDPASPTYHSVIATIPVPIGGAGGVAIVSLGGSPVPPTPTATPVPTATPTPVPPTPTPTLVPGVSTLGMVALSVMLMAAYLWARRRRLAD
ncbi:MAG: hypothetical protein Q7K03_07560 [Dehalococcoidia bacterium]|nr:hypothetical protein [Dehalococcoidia bacterium]